jgi:hypothetical protein
MAGNERKENDRRGHYALTDAERERVRQMQQRNREQLHGTSRLSRLALLRSLATDVTETAGKRIVTYIAPNNPGRESDE